MMIPFHLLRSKKDQTFYEENLDLHNTPITKLMKGLDIIWDIMISTNL